jgi:hypothetical protein
VSALLAGLVASLVLREEPDVRVRIESDVPVDIYEIDSAQNVLRGMVYVPNAGVVVPDIEHRESSHRLCLAPCSVTMPPYRAALEHRLVSDSVTDAGTFSFGDYGPAVLVQIKSGNADRYQGGRVCTIAGAITLGLSGLVTFIGAVWADARAPLVAGGVSGVALGVSSLVVGILMMVRNRTLVDIDADPTFVPPTPPPPVAPSQL